MKSRIQKGEELRRGRGFLEKAQVLLFADFSGMPTGHLLKLRKELRAARANFLVIKKRLLNLLLKEKKIDFDIKKFKLSVGTVFSSADIEKVSGPLFKVFSSLDVPEGKEKDIWIKHILGGYDLKNNNFIDPSQVIFIGKLPPREVLLAQLLGIFSAPIRSFLYILDQKSKAIK